MAATAGSGENPDSSTSTIVRASRRAFFQPSPGGLRPGGDGRFVPLPSATHRLLTRPAALPQERSHMLQRTLHAELPLQDGRHAPASPQITTKAERGGAFRQQRGKLLALSGGQSWRSTGGLPRGQALGTVFARGPASATDSPLPRSRRGRQQCPAASSPAASSPRPVADEPHANPWPLWSS